MKFSLDGSGNLKYIIGNKEAFLLDENVLIYGSFFEKESIIHLVYLQKSGTLNYVLFKDSKLHESVIGQFDTRSNTYNQIEVLLINNRLNVFYSYSNIINSNIYTLHHVIINEKTQEKYNIIRFASKKREKSFSVSYDSNGTIHLLYNTVSENFSYIYYTYFNPYKNQWLNSPTRLSSNESLCLYPSILVDSKDNIHSTFWESKDKGYYLIITRMPQLGREMFKWHKVNFPLIIEEKPNILICEANNLVIIETNNSKLISKDFGINYSEEELSLSEPLSEHIGDTFTIESNPGFLEANTMELKESNKIDLNENEIIESKEGSNAEFNELDTLDLDVNRLDNNELDRSELDNQEPSDLNNENSALKELVPQQEDIKLSINTLVDEISELKSRLSLLEEGLKNSKSGFKKFFGF